MSDDRGMSRRHAIGVTAGTLASAALYDVLAGPASALAATGAGQTAGLGYFARFGVTEKLIHDALGTALGSGGDHADVFFQHQVQNVYGLEDGKVNRAYADVQLGVGVRVVTGDQTGYGFTEELTPEGLKLAAQTAAAIATGPARPGPAGLPGDHRPARRATRSRRRGRTSGPRASCRSSPASTRRCSPPTPG